MNRFDDDTIQYDNTVWYDGYYTTNNVIDNSDGNITTNTNINTITTINDKDINNQNTIINGNFLDYFNRKYLYKSIQYTYTDLSEFKVDPFSELIYTNNLLLMLI